MPTHNRFLSYFAALRVSTYYQCARVQPSPASKHAAMPTISSSIPGGIASTSAAARVSSTCSIRRARAIAVSPICPRPQVHEPHFLFLNLTACFWRFRRRRDDLRKSGYSDQCLERGALTSRTKRWRGELHEQDRSVLADELPHHLARKFTSLSAFRLHGRRCCRRGRAGDRTGSR